VFEAFMSDWQKQRERMVRRQLQARGIADERLLNAFLEVPREQFVPANVREHAYEDGPLPIGSGQTISQPFIVATMVELLELESDDRVLEVGAGSGYAAAIMSRLARQVYGVELHEELAEQARARLKQLGYTNLEIRHGDGTLGLPEEAPFDGITAAAAAPRIPDSLKQQLEDGGRLVLPVGPDMGAQFLVRIVRTGNEFDEETLDPVRFVPLVSPRGR
jgi:protein-L-isoaspartate(D-aspartate) O-methyltransferase